jgi:hypothetical protein
VWIPRRPGWRDRSIPCCIRLGARKRIFIVGWFSYKQATPLGFREAGARVDSPLPRMAGQVDSAVVFGWAQECAILIKGKI